MSIIISLILSYLCCFHLILINSNLSILNDGAVIKTILSFSSSSSVYMIVFLILGVLSGSLSAFIISRYKKFNFIASIILPILLSLFYLYPSFFLPIFLIFTNVEGASTDFIDFGLVMFNTIFVITYFLFLRDSYSQK